MILTPEEILARFASRLSCSYEVGQATSLTPCAVSTLPYFLSSVTDGSCSFPCLSLKPSRSSRRTSLTRHSSSTSVDTAKQSRPIDHPNAAYLGRIVRVGHHSVAIVPSMLLRNVLCSFGHLIGLQLRRTLFVLMERSMASPSEDRSDQDSGDAKMTVKQKKLAAAFHELSSPDVAAVSPIAAVTAFRIVNSTSPVDGDGTSSSTDDPYGCLMSTRLPLEFEAAVEVVILGKYAVTVSFKAPGTISGIFTNQKNRPDVVDIRLNTTALLESMKRQCKDLVRRAVATSLEMIDGRYHEKHPNSTSLPSHHGGDALLTSPKGTKIKKEKKVAERTTARPLTATSVGIGSQTRSRSPSGNSPKPMKKRGRSSIAHFSMINKSNTVEI